MNTHAPRSTIHDRSHLLWIPLVIMGLIASSALVPILQDSVALPALDHDLAARPAEQSLPADVPADWWTGAQANIRETEYEVTWQDHTYISNLPAAYQAPNRAHNLRTYFAPEGIRLVPRTVPETEEVGSGISMPWEWGLTLTGYGYVGNVQPVTDAELYVTDNRIEYRRGALTEWYVNDERGLEQGFTLTAPPESSAGKPSSEIILDLALSGNLTPHRVDDGAAIEFTSPGGVRVLRYSDLIALDATGRELLSRLVLFSSPIQGEGSRVRVLVDTTAALYPITIDPLATTPNWTAESDQANAQFGWSVATAGDVNGDSYADIIVGAVAYDNGQPDEGRAFVYHGSATGLSATANWTAESNQFGAQFGYSVGTAGDVNGDGFADVIVGSHAFDNGQTNEGRAFVYHGSATGLATTPNWTAESDQAGALFGWSVGTTGDVNGDGFADVIVGMPQYDNGQSDEGLVFLYHGSAGGLSTTPNWTAESDQDFANFGWSVGTAGDVNGDGFADVIVGASFFDNGQSNEGRAFVYHGSAGGLSTTPNWTAESDQTQALFGRSVNTAGDVNGDGYADIIVGAIQYDNGQTDEGRAFVYHGSATGLSAAANWIAESDQLDAQFGYSVGTAGDVNGDGYADVIVGAWAFDNGQTDEGRVFVYHGSAAGLGATANWTAESDQDFPNFGWSVGTAGDVNGDGFADIIVGAHQYDNGQLEEGRAFVYHGSSAGLSTSSNWTAESDQADAWFGFSAGTAGDVNGDGYADIIVGAYQYDNGQTDEGRTFVYHGSATGLSTSSDWTAESNQDSAFFGNSVGTAGDVNGDGYTDVVVGALFFDNGQTNEGRAFVYPGSPTGLSASPNWTAESDQDSAFFGDSVSTAGDVNGDGYTEVIVGAGGYDNGQTDEGRAFVYNGSATGLSASPNWTAESNQDSSSFGISVSTAGDVNSDGYTDVIVGASTYSNGQLGEGRAFVYHGSMAGLSASPNWTAEGNQEGAGFGWSVGSAGDVNGDGYADVIAAAVAYDNGQTEEGAAFVYHGSAVGLGASPNWTAESDQANAAFGVVGVGTAGDVNGDGYADIIIGFYRYDNGQTDEGRALVYHGSATGLSASADWTAESDQMGALFGISVGTAGDVNGDGYADVIVGAYNYDNGETDEGVAFVYYGNDGAGLSLNPRQRRSDDSSQIAHLGRSESLSAFRLALRGRTPFGRGLVKLEWEVKPLGVLFDGTGTQQSAAWMDTGTAGAALNELVSGLTTGAAYHWRVRLIYHPVTTPFQQYSRWLTMPWNGWNEARLRMGTLPPTPTNTPIITLTASNTPPPTNTATPSQTPTPFDNTPLGTNVSVQPVDTTSGASPVTLTFAQVTQSGTTSLTTSSSGPPPPVGFKLGSPPIYYELTTTAVFSGTIAICINYTGTTFENDLTLTLKHLEGGIWEDRTVSLDTVNHIICGDVTSLSPFAIFESAYHFSGFFQPVDNLPTLNSVNAGRAIPVKFSLGGDQGLNIFAAGYPKSLTIACDSTAPVDGIEETVTAGSSSLTYDPGSDQYHYVWKTQKSWAGTCRQLVVKLIDGTTHYANFKFK